MPPLHLRQEFPTLKAFKEALHAWAIEAHFEPRILKSDTGRVRVGCKRDPNCPFVIRCNWERKGGREPLARVTVMREKHTCVNAVDWMRAGPPQGSEGMPGQDGGQAHGHGLGGMAGLGTVEIRQDEEGNIVGGARVLGPVVPVEGRQRESMGGGGGAGPGGGQMVPVLPKVQRNSASRLPFLLDILPRLMNITKQTTPVEIRECLLREYGAEVHLQQCRRAKTEILKQRAAEVEGPQDMGPQQQQPPQGMGGRQNQQSMDGMGREGPNDASQQLFADMNVSPSHSPHPFTLHTAQVVVTPVMTDRPTAALRTAGEPPVRCPYCINHRWMRSIKDAVEHMSMHVVV
ncbi:hypothetical protein OIDMADRAFT_55025 [Oidiodendron maius Zn]|uniref:Transposase MuDR plant domain-containing protein n=1 Tax=Oidiodendron maius (strain Zn) TaxID=913774 RepID=A0A0C3HDN6_OIDMZ|nr:hypothetical protein OIDMADRAFT_55025 [Oidiodendron maius Zn]